MTPFISTPLVRRASVFAAALFVAVGVTYAQSSTSNDSSSASGYSSSQAGLNQSQVAELAAPALPGGSAASPGEGAAGQYGTSGGGHGFSGIFHHYAFEAGAGFNGPVGNDTSGNSTTVPVMTWGGNFTLGGGLRLNNRLSVLAEYQFMDDKLPGPYISQYAVYGATAGDSHINSITASPVIDLFPKRTNGIYLVGGAGWYHKSTNLETPELEETIYGDYYANATLVSATSNQWGGNVGLGIYHKLGNIYGDSGHTELFAEARYTYLHTPSVAFTADGESVPTGNGVTALGGTTELIPVTLGVRF